VDSSVRFASMADAFMIQPFHDSGSGELNGTKAL
jgi:hypothetical protein